MLTTRSQRWRDRRSRFVPSASEIDPRTLSVDVIDTIRVAGPFIAMHHYAGSMPVTRLSVGLFRNGAGGRSELVGVCAFAHPINDASVPKSAGLPNPRTACDLGRLALLDDVGGNGETFLVSRAFKLLRQAKPEIISVISYADPIRRVDENGHVYLPGHVGQLYAVMGSRYVGRSSPRTDLVMPDGRPLSSRALSKIRNGETGQRYAIDGLVATGARPPRHGEDRRDWLAALERSGFLTR
ncbi:Mom family adenine methylcarbamoylation protein, partial [Novosphingobium naphthalenivorans]